MADPFGTLAPGNGLFGLTSPADQERNQLAELLRLYGDPARRQNKMATLLGGDILPGGGNRLPQGRDDPAYLGPPTIQPGSADWWIDQAIGFTPAGAVRDLVRVAEDAEALPPSPSFGQLAPVIGSGVLAAAGMIPGGKAAGKAAKTLHEPWKLARQQGYNTRLDLYHATTGDFGQFDRARHGTGATLPGEETGATWLASRPDTADSYLPRAPFDDERAARIRRPGEPTPQRPYETGANVMPVWVRDLDQFYQVDARGTTYDSSYVSNVLRAAKERGAPGAVFKNFSDPGPHSSASRAAGLNPNKPGTVIAVFADEKIRSKYAAFDPARKNERNILAGAVPLMTAGGATILLVPDPDEGGS